MASRQIETVRCKQCRRPFTIEEQRVGWGRGDPEEVQCPPCRDVFDIRNSPGTFKTGPLADEQERLWFLKHGV
jgi:hypothetical protein